MGGGERGAEVTLVQTQLLVLLTETSHRVKEGRKEGRNNLHMGYHRARSSGLLTGTPHGVNEGRNEGRNEGMKVYLWDTTEVIRTADWNTTWCE